MQLPVLTKLKEIKDNYLALVSYNVSCKIPLQSKGYELARERRANSTMRTLSGGKLVALMKEKHGNIPTVKGT